MPEPLYRYWKGGYILAAFGDCITTIIGQSSGLYEMNPVLRQLFIEYGSWTMIPATLLHIGILFYLSDLLLYLTPYDTVKKAVYGFFGVLLLVKLYIAVSNSLLIVSL